MFPNAVPPADALPLTHALPHSLAPQWHRLLLWACRGTSVVTCFCAPALMLCHLDHLTCAPPSCPTGALLAAVDMQGQEC
eukprot:1140885-Pelagomonas_calceolata.AAC.1